MARIPLINPQLIKVVATQVERTPAPVLKAEVVSSEVIKMPSDPPVSAPDKRLDTKSASDNRNSPENKAVADEQRYKVVLKIGQQQFETISAEDFKKGSLLTVKVIQGPELKIIANDKPQPAVQAAANSPAPAQAALQQLLADRIPNIQSPGLAKLIGRLSQLMGAGNSTATTSTATYSTATNSTATNSPVISTTDPSLASKAPAHVQTPQQALASLAYQSLGHHAINKSQAPNNTATAANIKPAQTSVPLQQVKDWLQQLPSTDDISNSTGLRNALNNTGVRAESQLSQLAQQFAILSKSPLNSQSSGTDKSANHIFQQLQKIQQTLFSKTPPPPLAKTDIGSIVQNTAQSLEKSSQAILANLTTGSLSSKTHPATAIPMPSQGAVAPNLAQSNSANPSVLNPQPLTQAPNNWQNPLLSNPAYSTLNELLKDPLLKNPSSNNKFALSQILNRSANQADSPIRIPLNWPERSGTDATFLRTLQNLLGHIEREQGIQLQQSDSNTANNPNLATPQNQQWLPLLIHHHQQLQLIEFFINKEEKKNARGEKKNHWFINLHFDLPQLGELGIEISMFENECNTTFWSESSSTLNQLSQHVQPLRERLSEQGIIVSDVQSRHGTLSKRTHNFEQRLVDIET